jgi:3-deoxy-D-manno-octulosonic acid (KDO) 8-phosphate synthase
LARSSAHATYFGFFLEASSCPCKKKSLIETLLQIATMKAVLDKQEMLDKVKKDEGGSHQAVRYKK